MLTEVKNNYKSVLKYFDFDESISSVDYKKHKLIEIAKRGEPRPSQATKEGKCLSNYTVKNSNCYCPKFDKTIRKLRPDWFESTSQVMKQKLIEMAKSGVKKPSRRKTKEGQVLSNYTRESSPTYCPEFDKTIRKLRPDWFESTSQIMKLKLIEMAKSGEKRPNNKKTKEGNALSCYTIKSSNVYCPEFDKTIRKLRPDWFESTSQIMKLKLIEMAKSGEKRPNNKKTKEGNALSCYTIKSSNVYCPEFDKTIRKLRSDWFIKSSDKKQLLIDIAKSGAKKPYYKTKEASALGCYTNKSSKSYCLKFDKTMHKLRPDWFIKPSDKNKQLLIEMANSGAKRPNNKKTKEGRALSTYTTKSNAYCPIFNKTIRKLRPDWFEKCSPK